MQFNWLLRARVFRTRPALSSPVSRRHSRRKYITRARSLRASGSLPRTCGSTNSPARASISSMLPVAGNPGSTAESKRRHTCAAGNTCSPATAVGLVILKAAPRPPRQAITPHDCGGPGHPVGGHLPPSIGRRGCHPRQRSLISRCHATIEPGTPDVRDGRDN